MFHAIVAHGRVDDVEAVLRTVDEVSRKHGVTLQLFDADAVYNTRHLESAVFHAERAFREGRNAANTLAAEVLMYVCGERQVQRAIERAGIRPGLDRTVVLALGYRHGAAIWELLDRLGWSRDPAGLAENPQALERYGLAGLNGGAELALLEHVAMLDLRK